MLLRFELHAFALFVLRGVWKCAASLWSGLLFCDLICDALNCIALLWLPLLCFTLIGMHAHYVALRRGHATTSVTQASAGFALTYSA